MRIRPSATRVFSLLCVLQYFIIAPVTATQTGSTVSASNIETVTRDVQQWHNSQHPACPFVKVRKVTVHASESETVIEHWTIEACAQTSYLYQVSVRLQSDGGIFDVVSNLDADAIEDAESLSTME